jgi:hypothetical protein
MLGVLMLIEHTLSVMSVLLLSILSAVMLTQQNLNVDGDSA